MTARKFDADEYMVCLLCEGMGDVFKSAADSGYDICSFSNMFLRSCTFRAFFVDMTIWSQSPLYVLDTFREEQPQEILKTPYEDPDAAEWMGYLFAAWHLEEKIDGRDIAMRYSIKRIRQSYDVLHTQDIRYAINFIKEYYVV